MGIIKSLLGFALIFVIWGAVIALIQVFVDWWHKRTCHRNNNRDASQQANKPLIKNKPTTISQKSIQDDRINEIANKQFEEFLKKTNSIQEKVNLISVADKKDFLACNYAAKTCILQVIKALKVSLGGHLIINNIQKNGELFLREFIILCAAYNNKFCDKDGRGYFAGEHAEDFHSGAYRLCKMWKLSNCNNAERASVGYAEVENIEERLSFYQDEIRFINNSQYGLPINLFYPLFNPTKKIDPAKSITEIDPIDSVLIWGIIKDNLKLNN